MPTFCRIRLVYFLLLVPLSACAVKTASMATESIVKPRHSQTPIPAIIPRSLGQIAYTSTTDSPRWSQVMLMDLDTGNLTNLTGRFQGEYTQPVWSPNGNRLLLSESIPRGGGGGAVMDVRLGGGKPIGSVPLKLFRGFAFGSTWSPDGTRVAYVTTAGGGGRKAFYWDLANGESERLPGIPEGADNLAWSPDGEWIAFAYYTDSTRQIDDLYKIRTDGTGLARLTSTPSAEEHTPVWSPDGTQIVFSRRERPDHGVGKFDLYRMNADGGGIIQITDDPADDYSPAWSPDGSRIAFVSDRNDAGDNNNSEIYVINVDGTGEFRMTNNHTRESAPTWRRTPPGTYYESCSPRATFVSDITIPAGTRFTGPRDFNKVWRIQNSGACPWAPFGYGLRLDSGESMGKTTFFLIPGAVQPGDTVDLTIPLTSPAASGYHSASWVLVDAAGRAVPALNRTSSDGLPLALTVKIEVVPAGTSILPSPMYYLSEWRGVPQIWRMGTDGVTRSQITYEPGAVESFSVSPADGSIAFISRNKLIRIGQYGSNRRILVDYGDCRSPGKPAFSPDGRLAYAKGGIRIFDPATGGDSMLLESQFGECAHGFEHLSPLKWSPDGSKLLISSRSWESDNGGRPGILSLLDNSVVYSDLFINQYMFAWTRDSRSVLFASSTYWMGDKSSGLDPSLMVLNASGRSMLLTEASVWWPFQRPEGRVAYFVGRPIVGRDAPYRVEMVSANADGSGEKPLRNIPLNFEPGDSFTAWWVMDGSGVVLGISHRSLNFNEVLFIPTGNARPSFLMQNATSIVWDEFSQ
jgi:Tol biopolymer transport system component